MDIRAKVKSPVMVHKPCAFNHNGANENMCRSISRVPSKNSEGCTKSGCLSLWRTCSACILQGGEMDVVSKPGKRLCKFHEQHGETAQRPVVNTAIYSLPKRSAYDMRFVGVERPKKVDAPAPVVKKQKQVHILPPLSSETAKPKAVPATLPAETPTKPEQLHAISRADSKQEGRIILERVRTAISNATYEVVEIGRIRRMENQPRKTFNPERLLRLADSIKAAGQIMPGYLRKVEPDHENHDRELVDGERRWRSMLMAGVPTFRAMLVEIDDEAAQYVVSTIANFNREGHTALEIADSIRVMHEDLRLPLQEIANSIGFSVIYVSNLYGLRRLAPEVRALLDPEIDHNRQLPVTAAIEISKLPQETQLPLAERLMKREVNLRTLRGEAAKISREHGAPINRRAKDPSDQRKTLERKADVVARAVADLRGRFDEVHSQILTDWPSQRYVLCRAEIGKAHKDLDELIQRLDGIRKKPDWTA